MRKKQKAQRIQAAEDDHDGLLRDLPVPHTYALYTLLRDLFPGHEKVKKVTADLAKVKKNTAEVKKDVGEVKNDETEINKCGADMNKDIAEVNVKFN